ncbi:biotin--[acetyl-CoA-carboxylase] ligase [Roseivirga sp. 4D4]|uniref:biotin--[acetyl-CoA-carboxylase] ligase n=1 Tax=Roseivirga sp. 4D4 TaxID=1889784 RepID=UPI001112F8D2|nr:biotin--[acetyl-CoA-carboxylase] ligase [Roseivirga sp. 4D4]
MPSCHSTNDIALEMIRNTDIGEGTVIITDHQINGRGQRGNSWLASPGENITMSLVLKPKFLEASQQYFLNMGVSLGVLKTVNDTLGEDKGMIKWPNDILIDKHKVAGVLIENVLVGKKIDHSIVGIGLNVNQLNFSGIKATSLRDNLGRRLELKNILESLVENIEAFYLKLKAHKTSEIKGEYLRYLLGYKTKLRFKSEFEFDGIIENVTDSGLLSVLVNGETKEFNFQEIGFIL